MPEYERVALRASAVLAVSNGEKNRDVARRFGVTRQTLHNWIVRYRRGGTEALVTRPNGRPRRAVLEPSQEGQVAEAITRLSPSTVNPRYTRWTKSAIAAFVEERFGVRLSPWQVDSHLRRWGFASHKAVRRAFSISQARSGLPVAWHPSSDIKTRKGVQASSGSGDSERVSETVPTGKPTEELHHEL